MARPACLHATESEGSEESWGVEDPTIRLALALGLDPLRLAWLSPLGPEWCAGSSPVAAANALKFALTHPPTAPAGGGAPALGGGRLGTWRAPASGHWLCPAGGCRAAGSSAQWRVCCGPGPCAGGPAGSHLKGTSSTAAKRRPKFGAQVRWVCLAPFTPPGPVASHRQSAVPCSSSPTSPTIFTHC